MAHRQIGLDGTEAAHPPPTPRNRQVSLRVELSGAEADEALRALYEPRHQAVGCACGRCILARLIERAVAEEAT